MERLLQQDVVAARLSALADEAFGPITAARFSVLAALHDFGKANHGFQAKRDLTRRTDWRGHIGPAAAALWHGNRWHSVAGALRRALGLEELSSWVARGVRIDSWLLAALAHHGRPVDPDGTPPEKWIWEAGATADPMVAITELRRAAAAWFPVAFEPGPPLPAAPAAQHAFAGLLMLADWIGSNRELFPFETPDGIERIAFARGQADRALHELGIDAAVPREALAPGLPGWARTFGHAVPRAAQRAIELLAPDPSGDIAVLEAETGSGKTEAAFRHFQRLFRAGLVDGLYFGLPTRAAALQIYERVCAAARATFGDACPPVVLAVPGYFKVDGIEGQKGLERFEVLWPDTSRSREGEPGDGGHLRFWAAEHAKRYLAGAIVVGTVDQVLLAGLAVPHAHMRAACLARHLLVVDEVHASDPYMRVILRAVLERHLSAGGQALLMSATLGAVARDPFLGRATTPLETAAATPYPSLTTRAEGPWQVGEADRPERPKRVRLTAVPAIFDPVAVAERVADAVGAGAKVLVIRNTVADAIATQAAIEARLGLSHGALFKVGEVPTLHHSRFTPDDRKALDREVEVRFGKTAKPGAAVLVGTQTVEISLDLDADLMISDLCPMDVLLQRLGRLHRHQRARPPAYEAPRLLVLVPAERDLGARIGKDGEARGRHGLTAKVYADLRVIEATWRTIETYAEIDIPRMNRALVEHATHPEALDAIVAELAGPWGQHEIKLTGIGFAKKKQAELNALPTDVPFGAHLEHRGQDERFPTDLTAAIRTRLGEDDRLVRVEPPARGPFGSVSVVRIPGWMARGQELREEAMARPLPPDAAGAARLDLAETGLDLVYDRFGLRRDREEIEVEE